MPKIFAQVLLPLALDKTFTYKLPKLLENEICIGSLVKVEFGKKEIWGVVLEISSKKSDDLAESKIKEILEKNLHFSLTQNHLKFIATISSYNLASKGLVLRAFIGILNSNRIKKEPKNLVQEVVAQKFSLKKLTPNQQKIVEEIWSKINSNQIFLLDGVTGSGKTELYFAMIARLLSQNSNHYESTSKNNKESKSTKEQSDAQILILLPEIALTSQLMLRFEEQFGFKPALWHSKVSPKNKREIFYGIVDGSVKVLIGARSALLLPFNNLRLVVIDEEHEASFKQEDVFNFHARDMAVAKAKIENFPVVLSSATPSLESFTNALDGKYQRFILEQKFGTENNIEIIDLRQEKMPSGNFLSQKLRFEIIKNLEAKKQTLLFLNRRGYAPITLCKTCGKKYQCSNCDFFLVLHKTKNQLTCHHCGHVEKASNCCKFCQASDSIIGLGAGVEKVQEEVKNLLRETNFTEAKISLITSDNVNSFDEAEKKITEILDGKVDIIIGTQMIAKGYDFPNLTLVGIIDADAMLYSSELRALERAYQIFTQVIGRAGRRSEKGKVLIQTHDPQNFIFEKIICDTTKSHKNISFSFGEGKKLFYDFELKNRKNLDLPPFTQLVRFEISSFVEKNAKDFAKKLLSFFPFDDKIELLGPAPAPLQKLKNRHHFLVHLKVQKKINLQKLVSDVLQSVAIPTSIRVRVDVNPL